MLLRIPLRFQREVVLHVLKNTQEHLLIDGTPSILCIFGAPGEGKTVMCKQILYDLGAHVETMSVAEFESEDAGKPAEILREKYNLVENYLNASNDNISVFMIDDLDTAIGNWGDSVQYTVNTQIIIGELMQLATNNKNRKVPIILTGNDFSKVYYPLRRSGRMNSFYWEPNEQERLDSVEMLFDWLTTEDCSKIINETEAFALKYSIARPPISFYSSIKVKLFDDDLWSEICKKRQNFDGIEYIKSLSLQQNSDYSYKNIIDLCQKELLSIKKSYKDYSGGKSNDNDENICKDRNMYTD